MKENDIMIKYGDLGPTLGKMERHVKDFGRMASCMVKGYAF